MTAGLELITLDPHRRQRTGGADNAPGGHQFQGADPIEPHRPVHGNLQRAARRKRIIGGEEHAAAAHIHAHARAFPGSMAVEYPVADLFGNGKPAGTAAIGEPVRGRGALYEWRHTMMFTEIPARHNRSMVPKDPGTLVAFRG